MFDVGGEFNEFSSFGLFIENKCGGYRFFGLHPLNNDLNNTIRFPPKSEKHTLEKFRLDKVFISINSIGLLTNRKNGDQMF